MSNETKRDVFEKALRELDDLVHSCGLQGEETHGGCEFDPILIKYKKDYDAALLDDMPVIPKDVADWIEKCKHNGIAIASAMDEDKFPKEVAYYFRTYYTRDQWIEIQDTFVRAWLDGYVVEE
ncbi:DUF1642 domain-containing protein [Lactiplantibacillus plantarum]|uniref:DUF1642 domain-containing protein n=1 Tax=Lactiplantibacillus plantarum TaxID=1590 RepID=UPI00222FC96F|nr:DUF1642 domain-containing protein [Lactiplantibacillus plantarum]UZD34564.1 DUF1642 domain-containing protein [Lactiplantibacillus plantarum]